MTSSVLAACAQPEVSKTKSICLITPRQAAESLKNEPSCKKRKRTNFAEQQQRCCETMAALYVSVCLARRRGEICHGNMFRPRRGSEGDASSSHRATKLQMNHTESTIQPHAHTINSLFFSVCNYSLNHK